MHSAMLGHLLYDWLVRLGPLPSWHALYAGLLKKNPAYPAYIIWALMYEQLLHTQRNSSTSGFNATCVLQGYLSKNTTHTVLPKLMAWLWNNSNSPAEYCKPQKRVSKETTYISSPKGMEEAWQSASFTGVDSHKSVGLRYSFCTKGLKTQPKNGMPISTQIMRNLSGSIMQGLPNVNRVEPSMALQKQRRTVTSQTWLMITTNWQFSWKHNAVKYLWYSDQPVCQMPTKGMWLHHKHVRKYML